MFGKSRSRGLLLAAAAIGALWLPASRAQAAYPDHPITLVVPFAAGAALEVMARVFTPALSQVLGQPIVILNKPGADGIIGLQTAVNAPPDGYTLVFSGGAEVVGPALHKTFPFDPTKALKGVALIGKDPSVVGVSSRLGTKDFASFADYAKKNSGKLNASAAGNSTRLGAVMLALALGVKAEIVAFDGNAQATTSVATGESDFAVQGNLSFAPFVPSGKINVILAAGDKRLPTLPDVPSATEVGLPAFSMSVNSGIYAGSGVPDDIVNKINAAVNQTLKMPDVVAALAKLEVQAADGTMNPKQFNEFYLAQLVQWKDIITKANIPMTN